VTASGSPDIHYQWQVFNGTDWTITGTDIPTYNTGILTQTTMYRVWVMLTKVDVKMFTQPM
jgi:hypothetical protein